jgi:hypothetical protein
MLKVSFDDNSKKVQVFNGRATVVTLSGKLKVPNKLWQIIPIEATNWIWQCPSVDASWGDGSVDFSVFNIKVTGKSVCSEEDTFNPKLGERIAESRAKVKLYKFMYKLCDILTHTYNEILFGPYIPLRKSYNSSSVLEDLNFYRGLWAKESHHLGELLQQA